MSCRIFVVEFVLVCFPVQLKTEVRTEVLRPEVTVIHFARN